MIQEPTDLFMDSEEETSEAPVETSTEEAVESADSTAESQTAEDTEDSKTATEEIDYESRLKSDSKLRDLIRREANALKQKEQARLERQKRKAELDRAAKEPDLALKYVQQLKRSEDVQDMTTARTRSSVNAQLDFLVKDPDWKDHYAELYSREGREEMDRRYNEDPADFARWALKETTKIAADKEVKAKATQLAKPMAENIAAQNLKKVAVPPLGAGSNRGVPDVSKMSLEEFLAKESEIDKAVNAQIERLTGRRPR